MPDSLKSVDHPPVSPAPEGAGFDPAARLQGLPDRLYAWAFPRWKWRYVKRCFPGRQVSFVGPGAALAPPGALLLWGATARPAGVPATMPVVRMEDGFLRSVGLGAELTRPLSWVVDTRGMYYDASGVSDLEWILAQAAFSRRCLARAAALRERLVAAGVTKYNVGQGDWTRPEGAARVILVPGQVESDASLAWGGAAVRTNMALLQAVRKAHPEAYLIYKPHPDVEAGLRIRGAQEAAAAQWCDRCVHDVPMERLLAAVDEVHTMTSLTGFEALLRGRRVVCYGQPFYAGWGLTQDLAPHPRRRRRLSLDELVAGVLILYPLYLSRTGDGLSQPEAALQALTAWKAEKKGRPPWWRDLYRAILRRAIGVH